MVLYSKGIDLVLSARVHEVKIIIIDYISGDFILILESRRESNILFTDLTALV